MKENTEALDEINKGCIMGMNAIDIISDKVSNDYFRKFLKKQYSGYEKISKKVNKIYKKYCDETPHEVSKMNEMMLWSGIELNTINDSSDSRIAELLLKGINMGIIDGRKIYNKKEVSEDVRGIISEYVVMQEEYVEKLKKYL